MKSCIIIKQATKEIQKLAWIEADFGKYLALVCGEKSVIDLGGLVTDFIAPQH